MSAIINILNEDWGPHTHTEVENALKSELGAMQTSITSLLDAITNIQGSIVSYETDPTVPAWAKSPTKPSYTAEEVGAMPSDAELNNITYDEQTTTLSIL